MSSDNSLGFLSDVKKLEVDPPLFKRCRGSGESMSPSIKPTPSAQNCTSMSFIPRPFPPPSLAGVPAEYIIEQLHNLAPHYWDQSQTADCTIIIPVPHPNGRPLHPVLPHPGFSPSIMSTHDKTRSNRRATEPIINAIPRLKFKLHMDYLSAHSTYLRELFSGVSPVDLLHSPTHKASSGQFNVPANRLPRLLPSSPHQPVLYLPIPDPSSFHLLVHWMYFGTTSYIEDCLHQGIIQWEGIARNVEYLGLPNDIKVFLGRWYGRWLHPERACYSSDDDDDETLCSGAEDDDDSSTASDSEPETDFDDEKEPIRGRTRAPRPLYPM